MRIAQPTPESLSYILGNLREWDRREIFALQWDDSPADLAAIVADTATFGFIGSLDRPIAAIGATPLWPGVWSMWMFATDEWRQISTSMTKHARRVILPALWAAGAHRLECRCMDGSPSEKWLRWLGATREATLQGYGRNRETFHVYVWGR